MAFKQLRTSATQTAVNAAGVVAAAVAADGGDFEAAFKSIFLIAEERLVGAVEADNETLAAEQAAEPQEQQKAAASKAGGSRGRKTNGGRSNGSRGGSSITLADAEAMVLKNGAFEGLTLGALAELSAAETSDDYGYGGGERSGADYIAWLSSDEYNNDYVQRRAQLIAADRGISY